MELDDIFSIFMKYKWDKGLNSEYLSPYAHAIWGTLEPFGLEGSPLRLIIDGITSFSGQGVFRDVNRSPLKRVGNTFSDIRKLSTIVIALSRRSVKIFDEFFFGEV